MGLLGRAFLYLMVLTLGVLTISLWQENSVLKKKLHALETENNFLSAAQQILVQRTVRLDQTNERLFGELAATKRRQAEDEVHLEQVTEAYLAHTTSARNLMQAEQLANRLLPEGISAIKDPLIYFRAAINQKTHALKLEARGEALTIPYVSPQLFFLAKGRGYAFKAHEYADDILVVTKVPKE